MWCFPKNVLWFGLPCTSASALSSVFCFLFSSDFSWVFLAAHAFLSHVMFAKEFPLVWLAVHLCLSCTDRFFFQWFFLGFPCCTRISFSCNAKELYLVWFAAQAFWFAVHFWLNSDRVFVFCFPVTFLGFSLFIVSFLGFSLFIVTFLGFSLLHKHFFLM